MGQNNNDTKSQQSSVAVFIDVENIHYSTLNYYSETPDWSRLVDSCKMHGRIASIQAFGDWINFSQEILEIQKNGIQPVFVPLSQDGKSSLDCYLIVSVMKLFFQNDKIDTLILASGDRDYIPLLAEMKALGKKAIILAIPQTLSNDLISIADDIISYKPTSEIKHSALKQDCLDKKSAQEFIVSIIKKLEVNSINNRWVNLANIGLELKKETPFFSHENYGYTKLSEMLDDISGIEIKYDGYEKKTALARTKKTDTKKDLEEISTGSILSIKEGYGFIRPDDESDNIFFHSSKVKDITFNELHLGDKVSFKTYDTDRGRNAEDICKQDI